MNIYEWIPSTDIAKHCEQIGHVFSPIEMTVIIANSDKPLTDKHMAYEEIIQQYPDMPMPKSLNFEHQDSLHDYLRELMAYEQMLLDALLRTGAGIVYTYEAKVTFRNERYKSEGVHSTAAKAIADFYERCDENERGNEMWIYKHTVDEEDELMAKYYSDGVGAEHRLCDIYGRKHTADVPEELGMIFIHIPVPFEKGDIVVNGDGEVRVLKNLPHWWENYDDFGVGGRGDGTDMVGVFYYLSEYFSSGFARKQLICDQDHTPYYRMKYHRGELEGQDQFLKYLSSYIKSKDCSIDWLINVWEKFAYQETCDAKNHLFGGWYLPLEKEK
ncbi:hypothetical protein LJC55_03265 [Eubacteriales bacterium OttesenSCG-928-N14]|nr:hypothetical protein [Eubacteriales bacterium OttesenSCG-928-N14]